MCNINYTTPKRPKISVNDFKLTAFSGEAGVTKTNAYAFKGETVGAKLDVSESKLDWFDMKKQVQGFKVEIASPYVQIGSMYIDFYMLKLVF
jgi:hypothetical protein